MLSTKPNGYYPCQITTVHHSPLPLNPTHFPKQLPFSFFFTINSQKSQSQTVTDLTLLSRNHNQTLTSQKSPILKTIKMVRKESAMKSGKKVGAQSASDAPIVIPFAINPKYPHFWKMNFLPERGYDMKEAHPSFEATVQALKWEGFIQHRTYYLEQIVREFYAGLMNKAEGVHAQYSLVRGKKVFFDEETINKHYNLQYSGNAFDEKYENYGKKKMEQIKNRIAISSAEWDKFTNREFKLKIRYIIPELSNWHMFINCSIMPTSHNYTLPKDRLIILDSIFTDDEINIGRIINNEIRDCAKKTEGYLFFPCLITALCLKQKVHITDNERNQRKFPPAALSAQMKARRVFKSIEELKEKKKDKKKVEAPEVDDKKQKALMKYLWEQHEWLEVKLANVAPTNLEMPQFPIWLLDNIVEEEEESEKEKSEDKEEPPTQKKNLKRKKETQRKGKDKKKVTEEMIVSDDLEETEEEEEIQEEVKRMEKETDEENDDTATEDSEEKEKDDFDLGLSLEELLQKTKGKNPILEQQTPTNPPLDKADVIQKEPTKSPSPPPSAPPSTGTTPPPLDKADVIQKEPTKEAPQTQNQTKEKTPPILDETIISANISVETGARQDLNVSPTKEVTEEETPAEVTGASAPGASAPDNAAPTVIQMSDDPQTTMSIVALELALKRKEIAEKKRAEKEAKKQGEGVSKEKVTKEAAKDKEEEAVLKDVAETLKDLPASAVKGTEAKSPGEGTPKPSKSAALKTDASASKATGSSKKKAKPTPTRSSNRIRSGVKPQ